jgi:Flp pilus assembly protein TadD
VKIAQLILAPLVFICSAAQAQDDAPSALGAESYLQQADQAVREGRLTQAQHMIYWLEQNTDAISRDDLALVKAEFAVVKNDVAGASTALDSIVDRSRNLCRQDTARGWVAANRNALDKAILSLANAVKNCPHDAGIWNLLGLAFVRKGETAAGKEAFEQALILAPDNSDLLNNHALALIQHGHLALAKQQLDRAAKTSPENRLIAANRDFVSGMIGQTPIRAKGDSDAVWSERLINTAKGAKAADHSPQATALFSRALLLLDRFDGSVWSEIKPQTGDAR